ncbi:MAG: exodeoxyribonuclease VII large subunit [Oscillospiraceae bacterium]
MAKTISVSALNLYVKSMLESDDNLCDIAVEGEISNFVNHYKSGHFYFALKDDTSLIKTVMFSFNNKHLNFLPENGMKVVVRGKVSLYERDGTYQLYAQDMFLSGQGAMQLAFERLKEKLNAEGLFDTAHKKTLPPFPFKIGVATSATGAALHDIISVANRRFPCVEITLAACSVQGSQAEDSIIRAIKALDRMDELDLIIIARGGGSTEDLWVFNSEAIARTAYNCKKPTISAVGHEIDFSILDFVCDMRAATPTAAAELALPDIESLSLQLMGYERTAYKGVHTILQNYQKQLTFITASKGFTLLETQNQRNGEKVAALKYSIDTSLRRKLEDVNTKVSNLHNVIESQSPLNNLKRGYSLLYKDKLPAKDTHFTVGDTAQIVTFSQELTCKITETKGRGEL